MIPYTKEGGLSSIFSDGKTREGSVAEGFADGASKGCFEAVIRRPQTVAGVLHPCGYFFFQVARSFAVQL